MCIEDDFEGDSITVAVAIPDIRVMRTTEINPEDPLTKLFNKTVFNGESDRYNCHMAYSRKEFRDYQFMCKFRDKGDIQKMFIQLVFELFIMFPELKVIDIPYTNWFVFQAKEKEYYENGWPTPSAFNVYSYITSARWHSLANPDNYDEKHYLGRVYIRNDRMLDKSLEKHKIASVLWSTNRNLGKYSTLKRIIHIVRYEIKNHFPAVLHCDD